MSEVSPELVERMVALVRTLGSYRGAGRFGPNNTHADDVVAEACAIAILLPEQVDPDLIEARRMAAADLFTAGTQHQIESGQHDDGWPVRIALAAIKRGRELAGQPA